MPVRSVPVPGTLLLAAARLKARFPISHADAVAAETALRAGAPLVTGEPDFRRLEAHGLLQVDWIGA